MHLEPMPRGKKGPLDGQVALVADAAEPCGRATALALAARGVRVLVTGRFERAIAEVVGESANGAGKARHWVGDVAEPASLTAAVARATEVFGSFDLVVRTTSATEDEAEAVAEVVVFLCTGLVDLR